MIMKNNILSAFRISVSVIWLLCFYNLGAQEAVLDLSGSWSVTLETTGWTPEQREANRSGGAILLPGSLAENGYGLKTEGSDYGILTPEFRFVGKAVYEREINIPKSWKTKELTIYLERVLWRSTVYVDGRRLGSQEDGLGSAHIHKIGRLAPGLHHLKIEVDNGMIHNIGDKGHAYSDYTQSIWNGIVGRMELQAQDPVHINSVTTFPDLKTDRLRVKMEVTSDKMTRSRLGVRIFEVGKDVPVLESAQQVNLANGDNELEILLDLNGRLRPWSEFKPTVYRLMATLTTSKTSDTRETEFGFLEIGHNGTHVTINGQPIFLRGNLDCVHFPLTGYPSTRLEDWMNIFRTYKEYGLNHVRFHSWCPPEAAFRAANRLGIYIQAEASIWIDWWMSEDMVAKGRPEMDTKGHPKGLGKDPERDAFVIAEMDRVVDAYGNNPSFAMFCIGNELGNSDFDVTQQWVAKLKQRDPRRLYSVSTARKVTPVDDYMATHYIPEIGRTRGLQGPHTDWDFEAVYSKMDIPIIAHEIGQWPVYPSWDEIGKYTGVLKARNLEGFKKQAEEHGIASQVADLTRASGALNQIMYKYETESFLRTKSCAGVQLLSMQDYQGQGEALIGWLDAFWDSKGITTSARFRQHFDETVPLLRLKKFVWTTDETLEATAQLSHFGAYPIPAGEVTAKITADDGSVIHREKWDIGELPVGSLTEVGKVSFPLSAIDHPQKLTISVSLDEGRFRNEWDIWVYPVKPPVANVPEVLVADSLDDNVLKALENGGKVFLKAHGLGNDDNSVNLDFYPLYWSLTFFPGQGKTALGLLIQDRHSAFDNFPTSFHSDWQWETVVKDAKAFLLNDAPKSYRPLVQVVDDFHRNNKEGVIAEFKVGKGKLLICGVDIDRGELPVARQLKYSLLSYMASDAFAPDTSVDAEFLHRHFPAIPEASDVRVDAAFPKALLQVDAAARAKITGPKIPWSPEADSVKVQKEGVAYTVSPALVRKEAGEAAWYNPEITLEVTCPDGILGSFYVLLDDWGNRGRVGVLTFEGRKVRVGPNYGEGGNWVKFHVMREDSNDGKLVLHAKAEKGGDLLIKEIVLEQE